MLYLYSNNYFIILKPILSYFQTNKEKIYLNTGIVFPSGTHNFSKEQDTEQNREHSVLYFCKKTYICME